jgi:hypothetical protein
MQFESAMSASRAGRACFSTLRRVVLTRACALVALASVACGDGDPTSPDNLREGTGTVSTSGAVRTSGSGVAFFQSIGSGNLRVFQIVVAPASQSGNNVWALQIASSAGRPAAGTYQLTSSSGPTNILANFSYVSGGRIDMYTATSGEVVITSSSTSAVRGTINFTGATFDGTGTVTTQGSFNARCAPGFECL